MKSMSFGTALALVAILCMAGAGAHCQAGAPGAAPITAPLSVQDEVRASYTRVKGNLLKSADLMPAEGYGFRLFPDVRTFARVLNHVTEAQFRTCSALTGTPLDPKAVPGDEAGKEAVVAGLRASFALCDKAYASTPDASLTDQLTLGNGKRSRIGLEWGNVAHDSEQYAQVALYLRGKGLTPPSSEK